MSVLVPWFVVVVVVVWSLWLQFRCTVSRLCCFGVSPSLLSVCVVCVYLFRVVWSASWKMAIIALCL